MDLLSPRDIYKEVLKETESVLHTLEVPSESAGLSNATETAKSYFAQSKSKSDALLNELDSHAEWDALTVAFYGETNAGKSTIIETLRILLGEKTKREQQRKFREICGHFNVGENIAETWTQIK